MAEANRNTTIITRRPVSDDQAFIEGAKEAMSTLRNIDAWIESQRVTDMTAEYMTADEYHAGLDAVIDAAMAPLDGLPPKQRGYVRALVEALDAHRRGAQPDPDDWVPKAMMTADELAKRLEIDRASWDD